MSVPAAIVIPTGGRPGYLAVALGSIAPQARADGAEIVVVDDAAADGPDTRRVAERYGARWIDNRGRGLNAARNRGVQESDAELVVFCDDDVEAPPGWLAALLAAAGARPEAGVFGGPIRPRLEGPRALRMCGREGPPVTFLDLGEDDRETDRVWGANMAVRREAFERQGLFDERIGGAGDEEEWQRIYRAGGGQIRYVGAAGLVHRRAPGDSGLVALSRGAVRRGEAARRYDVHRGAAPGLAAELLVLLGCLGHFVRRACPNGIAMAAHSLGRLRQALAPSGYPPAQDFLSGESGEVGGRRDALRSLADAALDLRAAAALEPLRLDLAARRAPVRRVLVAGIERPGFPGLMGEARSELERSHHALEWAIVPPVDGAGKFAGLNAALEGRPLDDHDWLLVIDDDVELPRGFLDRFLFLAERFELRLAQPAHRRRSHAAWRVTRRRPGVVRETRFVEIGPVTAFHRDTFPTLLPFPALAMGWGLDLHWGALARERGWRAGIVDATPIRHAVAPAAAAYDRERAIAEAQLFLDERPYITRGEAQRTLAAHRRW